jgi:TIR domain
MSQIFISYKRADELQVSRLVKALEGAGRSVWWDRGLAGAESWRNQIQSALDAAKCVIVVWTHESVGPAGDFVRDEAGQAKRRGVLVPVRLDKVEPPLGFGEIQVIDLTGWKGSSRDPFFQDLLAATAAKLEGRAVPAAKGPMKRLMRRLTYSSAASALLLGIGAFGSNMWRLQDHICGASLFQPYISDACGALGLGDRPAREERIAWAKREPGSCAALRLHIERFPKGAYRAEATSLLAARRPTQSEVWTPVTRRLALFQPQEYPASSSEAKARSAALDRAQDRAERLCKGFAATASFRLRSAAPEAERWNCDPGAPGVVCTFEGEAVCELDERGVVENETCGK